MIGWLEVGDWRVEIRRRRLRCRIVEAGIGIGIVMGN